MIVNTAETTVVSNLGWVDRGSLWMYALGEPEPRHAFLSDSHWLSIIRGTNDYFAVVHEGEESSLRLTAHSFESITEIVSSFELRSLSIQSVGADPPELFQCTGDGSVWSFLPKAYIVRTSTKPFLLMIEASRGLAMAHALPWYETSYDTLYQGILGVTEIPASSHLMISIQRDSRPILYDPTTGMIVKKLELAARGGNPQLFFRKLASELWASDYDTIVRLDSHSWKVLDSLKLQEAQDGMAKLFIGKYCFSPAEDLCVVARPYSGDVVGVDPNSFTVVLRAETGAQPQDVGLLLDKRVVARDWKTGKLLNGMLKAI